MISIEYIKNKKISNLINSGEIYQKIKKTYLRLPSASEVGKEFITYVKDGDTIRKESSNVVGDNVIARNSTVLGLDSSGQKVYNEWLVPTATAIKSICSLSDTEFSSHKKQAKLRAVELTPEIMKILGVKGDTLNIKVSWSPEPMVAKLGDYITDGGYCVSKHDMKDYELVSKQETLFYDISTIEKNSNKLYECFFIINTKNEL